MNAVLFDFNGTLLFDTCFHLEAWTKIYREIRGEDAELPDMRTFCGPPNDELIARIDPHLTPEERTRWSVHKEEVYREMCEQQPEKVKLTKGAEELFEKLREKKIPFTIASAAILDNIEFYFKVFRLDRWFSLDMCVYDNGEYQNKGEMHLEAARKLGTFVSRCVIVEDSPGSIAYAKKNGAGRIVGIGEDAAHAGMLQAGAELCIHDFTEFDLTWLKQ